MSYIYIYDICGDGSCRLPCSKKHHVCSLPDCKQAFQPSPCHVLAMLVSCTMPEILIVYVKVSLQYHHCSVLCRQVADLLIPYHINYMVYVLLYI